MKHDMTNELSSQTNRQKQKENARKMFLLWEYLATEGLQDDAREYLLEHEDEELPFEITF